MIYMYIYMKGKLRGIPSRRYAARKCGLRKPFDIPRVSKSKYMEGALMFIKLLRRVMSRRYVAYECYVYEVYVYDPVVSNRNRSVFDEGIWPF
jgi:hypothetical protein